MNIIFTGGFGFTGSGAVLDLLREVENIHVMNNEFRVIVDPDGLLSLRRNITKYWSIYNSDIAIKRFMKIIDSTKSLSLGPYTFLNHSKEFNNEYKNISNQFIQSLIKLRYKGYWFGNDNMILRIFNHRYLPNLLKSKYFRKKMYLIPRISQTKFDKIARRYIYSLINSITDKDCFCFDEGFIGLYIDELLEILPDCKIIIIVRDPKDVIATTKYVGWKANPINVFRKADWLFETYSYWVEYLCKQKFYDNQNVKIIKFEDLIIDYNCSKDELFNHLNISVEKHKNMKKYLNPELSKVNVGIWKNILTHEESIYIDKKFKEFNLMYEYL